MTNKLTHPQWGVAVLFAVGDIPGMQLMMRSSPDVLYLFLYLFSESLEFPRYRKAQSLSPRSSQDIFRAVLTADATFGGHSFLDGRDFHMYGWKHPSGQVDTWISMLWSFWVIATPCDLPVPVRYLTWTCIRLSAPAATWPLDIQCRLRRKSTRLCVHADKTLSTPTARSP